MNIDATRARFLDRRRSLAAAGMSLLALLVLSLYVAIPGGGGISFAASYAKGSAKVIGAVTDDRGEVMRNATVTLAFTRNGRVIKRVTATIGTDGKFRVAAPRGATGVRVSAAKGDRKASKRYALRRGKTLRVGIKVPRRGGVLVNLLPAFPF